MCKDEESISFLNLTHAILAAMGALEWKQWNKVIAKGCYHCRDCFCCYRKPAKAMFTSPGGGVPGTGVEGERAGNRAHITHRNASHTELDNQTVHKNAYLLPHTCTQFKWNKEHHEYAWVSLVVQQWRICLPESACSIPGSGRSPGEGNGNPFQYSFLENPISGWAWQATVHGVTRVRHNLATESLPRMEKE